MRRLEGVRPFYRTGDEITLDRLPAGASRAGARRGDAVEADVGAGASCAGAGRRHLFARGARRRRPHPGRGTDDGGDAPRRAPGARLRHLLPGRRRARRPGMAGGAALHRGADLRLDGQLLRAPRPEGGLEGPLEPARVATTLCAPWPPGSSSGARWRTPMHPFTPPTYRSPPIIPSCSWWATMAARNVSST